MDKFVFMCRMLFHSYMDGTISYEAFKEKLDSLAARQLPLLQERDKKRECKLSVPEISEECRHCFIRLNTGTDLETRTGREVEYTLKETKASAESPGTAQATHEEALKS